MASRFIGVSAVVSLGVMLAGCASSPAPSLAYDGNYYMAGDSNCKYGVTVPAGTPYNGYVLQRPAMICTTADGKPTGHVRHAMSQQDMQMYQMQMAAQQAQMAAFTQQLNQTSESLRRNAEAMSSMASSYTPPAVAPITYPGSNQVRCISAGSYTNCRY